MPVEHTVLTNTEIFNHVIKAVHKVDSSFAVNLHPAKIIIAKDGTLSQVNIFLEAVEYADVPYAEGRKHLTVKKPIGNAKKFVADKKGIFKWADIAKFLTTDEVVATATVTPLPSWQAKQDLGLLKNRYIKHDITKIATAGTKGISLSISDLSLTDAALIIRELQYSVTYKL